MNKIICIILVVVASLTGCATMKDSPDNYFKWVFGESGNTISYSPEGGNTEMFKLAAKEVVNNNRQVRIDGECIGGCAIFATIAKTNVCITGKAKIKFDQMSFFPIYNEDNNDRPYVISPMAMHIAMLQENMPLDIVKWIDQHGAFYASRFVSMSNSEALKFWKPCGDAQAAITPASVATAN